MKKLHLLVMLCFISAISSTFAQTRTCHAQINLEKAIAEDPEIAYKMLEIEKATQRSIASRTDTNRAINGEIVTIPVVVHVVYFREQENISEAQIVSQIEVINEDFRLRNSDRTGAWSDREADIQIEFCLATEDPNGNPTNGITRTRTTRAAIATNNSIKSSRTAGQDAWDTTQYLNMWVGDTGGDLLGYAQFPGSGRAETDGVVIGTEFFGSRAKTDGFFGSENFDLGRTATHEIGHFLNLRHIWGDGDCGQDDLVNDTPLAAEPNGGCPSNPNSCQTTNDERDMYENYMDYTADRCMNLFTEGQKSRMRAVLASGGFRASLARSTKCSGVIDPNPNPNPPTDNEAPSAPGTLSASDVQDTTVQLSWGAATDNVGVVGYQIFSGNGNLGTVTGLSTAVSSLVAGESYTFSVRAIDEAGNTSPFSNTVTIVAGQSAGKCAGVPEFDGNTSYSAGDQVVFRDTLFERTNTGWINLGSCNEERRAGQKTSATVAPPFKVATSVKVYPNPVRNGNLSIEITGSFKQSTFTVTNLMGQLVQKGILTTNSENLNVSSLKSGIYMVNVTTDAKVISKTIAVE